MVYKTRAAFEAALAHARPPTDWAERPNPLTPTAPATQSMESSPWPFCALNVVVSAVAALLGGTAADTENTEIAP